MTGVVKKLLVTALIGGMACGFVLVRRQQNRLAALQAATERAAASVERIRREGGKAREAAISPPPPMSAEPPAANPAWEQLGRKAGELRQFAAENPEKGIPELALLTEADWLMLAENLKLESDEDQRKALRTLRSEAKMKLGPLLQDALLDYAAVHDGQLPADVAGLAPFLEGPVSADMLQRYDMLKTGPLGELEANAIVIAERVPVDDLPDSRQVVGLNGYGQAPIDRTRYLGTKALAAFVQANPGRSPTGPLDLQPFLEAPLASETLDSFYRDWARLPGLLGDYRSRWNQRQGTARSASAGGPISL